MKQNFLYQITAASRTPLGYRPQIPVLSVLCPQLNLLNTPPPPNKIPGYATGCGTFDHAIETQVTENRTVE